MSTADDARQISLIKGRTAPSAVPFLEIFGACFSAYALIVHLSRKFKRRIVSASLGGFWPGRCDFPRCITGAVVFFNNAFTGVFGARACRLALRYQPFGSVRDRLVVSPPVGAVVNGATRQHNQAAMRFNIYPLAKLVVAAANGCVVRQAVNDVRSFIARNAAKGLGPMFRLSQKVETLEAAFPWVNVDHEIRSGDCSDVVIRVIAPPLANLSFFRSSDILPIRNCRDLLVWPERKNRKTSARRIKRSMKLALIGFRACRGFPRLARRSRRRSQPRCFRTRRQSLKRLGVAAGSIERPAPWCLSAPTRVPAQNGVAIASTQSAAPALNAGGSRCRVDVSPLTASVFSVTEAVFRGKLCCIGCFFEPGNARSWRERSVLPGFPFTARRLVRMAPGLSFTV